MSLKIYGIIASRAIRPLWVAEEARTPYQHVPVDYKHGGAKTTALLALNPNGHVPVVDDGGVIVWESMACALYLARKYGGLLAAQCDAEEAAMLMWSFWAVTECEKDALTTLMHRAAMPEAERKAELADSAQKRLAAPLRVLDAHLQGKAWITGDRFTVADISVAAVLMWARVGAAISDDLTQVQRWLSACLARPAYVKLREVGN